MKELFIDALFLLGVIVVFVIAVMVIASILESLGIIELPNDKNE